jgi:hypothetical protein
MLTKFFNRAQEKYDLFLWLRVFISVMHETFTTLWSKLQGIKSQTWVAGSTDLTSWKITAENRRRKLHSVKYAVPSQNGRISLKKWADFVEAESQK